MSQRELDSMVASLIKNLVMEVAISNKAKGLKVKDNLKLLIKGLKIIRCHNLKLKVVVGRIFQDMPSVEESI